MNRIFIITHTSLKSTISKTALLGNKVAQEYSITFNAKKSKCTVAAPRNRRHLLLSGNICPFVIDGKSIDFVDSFPHLGHIISSVSGDNEDIFHRRCKFIGQINSVPCDFWNLGSDGKYRLFKSFSVICIVVSCGI